MTDATQTRTAFFELVDDVCKELGYPPRSNRPDQDDVVAMEMDLDGYPFAVVHSMLAASDRVLIECRFGAVPKEDREKTLIRLLQLNYALADAGEQLFGIEAESGDVLFTRSCVLEGQTGRSMLSAMTQMSWQAAQWNQHRFLDTQAPSTPQNFPADFGALA